MTGFVHADPHEGNLLYTEDGRIAFLDFGLMDRVAPAVMQGFAEGMKAIVAREWQEVALRMQDINWTTIPVKRNLRPGLARPVFVDCDFQEFADALAKEFEEDSEAQAKLGATVAAIRRLSDRYLMLTPPYVVLITRTFVTLEGLVDRVDPDYNIYTMALPVTLRRLLCPATAEAREALRERLLTEDGEVKWNQLEGLFQRSAGNSSTATGSRAPAAAGDFRPMKGLLGSSDGAFLRRVCYDVDVDKMIRYLSSRSGSQWRRRMARSLANSFERRWQRPSADEVGARPRPESVEELRFEARNKRREQRALRVILRSQLKRGGIVVASAGLALSGLLLLRIVGGAAALTLGRRLRYLRGLRILRAVRYLLPLAVVSRAFRRRNTDDAK